MFHVPEMSRVTKGPMRSDASYGNNGAFDIASCERAGWRLAIIAADGSEQPDRQEYQWEHVSVHVYREGILSVITQGRERQNLEIRTPYWSEMCQVKDLFWDDEDVVMQLHPRQSEYINRHESTLHLWRPRSGEIPTPPKELVG